MRHPTNAWKLEVSKRGMALAVELESRIYWADRHAFLIDRILLVGGDVREAHSELFEAWRTARAAEREAKP